MGVNTMEFIFKNGYGASIIGDHNGKEIAVTHNNGIDGFTFGICYLTPLTSDVMRVLDSEVADILKRIEALPTNNQCQHAHKSEYAEAYQKGVY
jgi:hypothetical protein